jgi:hypothetical protein
MQIIILSCSEPIRFACSVLLVVLGSACGGATRVDKLAAERSPGEAGGSETVDTPGPSTVDASGSSAAAIANGGYSVAEGGASSGAGASAGPHGNAHILRDSSLGCPTTQPATGTVCSAPGQPCQYGSLCCGGGRRCAANGSWEPFYLGCACFNPADAGSGHSDASLTCVQNVLCVRTAHWDSVSCKCVANEGEKVDGDVGNLGDAGSPNCSTPSDCHGFLPALCALCADGVHCAHFECVSGQCNSAICPSDLPL